MGSTHSKKQSEDTTRQAANGICCMVPRPPRLATILRMLRRHLSPAQNKQKLKQKQRSMAKRRALLRPMPRCSSFGSCGTLLTPTKRRTTPSSGSGSGSGSGAISTADLHYAQWKCMFEQERQEQEQQQQQQKESQHNTSEALSGQTTPRGFPSHTDPSRCLVPEEPLPSLQSPLYDYVGDLKVRRRLSLRSPLRGPSTSRQRSQAQAQARARLEAQLERELRDLEEYYGGFHFSQRSERFVRI